MAKPQASYICQSCGAVSNKWSGQCVSCGEWNSISEEAKSAGFTKISKGDKGQIISFESLTSPEKNLTRWPSGNAEMDRVTGGGLVPGSAILIGGDPGIGKSTLLLQIAASLASEGHETAYITGEESIDQVRLRAQRLGLSGAPLQLATATSVRDILSTLSKSSAKAIIIDSIQTMFVDNVESVPGTVTQVRTSAHELITHAKQAGAVLFLVGHVTKEGQIAGPKILEHMVDTVLYFEGERGHQFRILRAVKNRFGAANELGVFEMTSEGLKEVPNPSALFLSERDERASGSAVFAGMEGTRPILVEIQALVSPSPMAMPRRAVVGWDANRLAMLIAVLQTRAGLQFYDKEVFLNVAGGLRITEPAADLAVAAALISALRSEALPADKVYFGEIGLSGEVRQVSHAETRIREAEKLGFQGAFVPRAGKSGNASKGFILQEIRAIRQLL